MPVVLTVSVDLLLCWLSLSETATLSRIRSEAPRTARAIHTLQCTIGISSDDTVSDGQEAVFYASSDRFRVESRRSGKPPLILAFNGTLHQRFCEDEYCILEIRRSEFPGASPYGVMHPVTTPYIWLFVANGAGKWSLDALRDPSVWATRLASARSDEPEDCGGHQCGVVWLDDPRDETWVYKVYFAEDIHCYPIKWQRFVGRDRLLTAESVVQEMRREKADDDIDAIVPTLVRYTEHGRDGVSLPMDVTLRVPETGLFVNQDIDADLFTISRLRAKEVIDLDENNARLGRESVASLASERFSRKGLWVGGALLLGAVLAMAAYLARKVESRHE